MASRRSDLIGVVADFDDPAFFGDTWAQAYAGPDLQPTPALAVEFLAALADDTGAAGQRTRHRRRAGGTADGPPRDQGRGRRGVAGGAGPAKGMLREAGLIQVTMGDMADVPVDDPFRLVSVVRGALVHLPSQARPVGLLPATWHGYWLPGGCRVRDRVLSFLFRS